MTDNSTTPIRRIYTRDNLPVLRSMDSETVDLIYLDPPFNSGRQWVKRIQAAKEEVDISFKDTWDLDDIRADYEYIMWRDCPDAVALIDAMAKVNGDSWKSYLTYMGVRILEMHRILKPTGSIYYHCDPTMSHGVKLLIDAIFGNDNFRNEVLWCYRTGGISRRWLAKKHDVILVYGKDKEISTFNIVKEKSYLSHKYGFKNIEIYRDAKGFYTLTSLRDWWVIDALRGNMKQAVGYPTQKPLELLERVIESSSNEGDLVLDPFCGCATTCVAAEHLGRNWIGIDLSKVARELVISRLEKDVVKPLVDPYAAVETPTGLPKRTDLKRTDDDNIRSKKYEQQNGKCARCDRKIDLKDLTIDLIIGTENGGQDEDQNIQLLCTSCNSEKGARGMEYLIKKIAAR